ncbi:MAG TPA: hypothetical protein VFH73_21450 [Polyangia bacterium]|jgi:hypothetical protein|nr:hypothetical protein [Polyangia bacterium]
MLTSRLFLFSLPLTVVVWAVGAGAGFAQAAPSVEPERSERDAPSNATFEALTAGAVRTTDVGTLLVPFVDSCDGEKRDIERIRCRTIQSYLRETLPERTFLMTVDDPAAVSLSDYDASIKGYRLGLAGCVACTAPVTVGRSGQKRLVSLKAPQKEAESLAKAVEISRSTLAFDSLAEARRWMDDVRPFLRAEFLFQPEDNEWSFGVNRGYAFKLVAGRVFNRCTGEVLVSQPPSTGAADKPAAGRQDESCARARAAETTAAAPAGDGELPAQLTTAQIAQSMDHIRSEVYACYEKYQVAGNAQLAYVVGGNGMVKSIRVTGAFDGTPTGTCVLDAGKTAKFSRFKAASQSFTYPFFLRR